MVIRSRLPRLLFSAGVSAAVVGTTYAAAYVGLGRASYVGAVVAWVLFTCIGYGRFAPHPPSGAASD